MVDNRSFVSVDSFENFDCVNVDPIVAVLSNMLVRDGYLVVVGGVVGFWGLTDLVGLGETALGGRDFECDDPNLKADREKALKDFNEVYDCDLEQMAMVLASGCPGKAPNLKRAITFSRFNDDAKTIEDVIKEGTDTFFTKQVKWPKKNILPDVNVDYYPFVTMVNANATAVGCYKEACDNSGAEAGTTVVCFYDVP
ncbi:unnamed protein product [Nippostrongylus brasiliensis]|uniref:SCP domain-containing protein n=1 Tax=Nippostrongylus brasiliensis TaxID=27835 RepID=A0A0N4XDR0_NIPBR|nr:unnamed protein product [Nippostrongylus brasiliensis]